MEELVKHFCKRANRVLTYRGTQALHVRAHVEHVVYDAVGTVLAAIYEDEDGSHTFKALDGSDAEGNIIDFIAWAKQVDGDEAANIALDYYLVRPGVRVPMEDFVRTWK